MKKLLVLTYEFPPLGGGAGPVGYEIAERLSETGDFDIDAVTMGYKDLKEYEEVNQNFRIHRVKCLRSKKEICHPWEQATYLFSAYSKCKELIRKNKYDICHTHFLVPTGILAVKLKEKFSLPYIITAHGSDVPGFNTDRFKFMHKFTGPLLRKVCRNADLITAPSDYLKSLILKNIDTALDKKTKVIPNGFDPDKFKPAGKKKIILGTGRLLPRKGFQHLISACADENIGYEIHICGDGPMMKNLKYLQKNSKTKVVLHGWVDNRSEKYKNLLESADIFTLPSSKENASVALLEGMSAGCAVVTSDTAGCPETVGDTAVLVKPENTMDLKQKLTDLTQDQNKIRSLQSKARERLVNKLNWDIVIKEYLNIL